MPYANSSRNYNTRNSGRYNTAGQFVSGGDNQDVDMDVKPALQSMDTSATGGATGAGGDNGADGKPAWMKSKLLGDNTRNSGRYNTAGQFVSGGDLSGAAPGQQQGNNVTVAGSPMPQRAPRASIGNNNQDVDMDVKPALQSMDTSATGGATGAGGDNGADGKPAWMKSKLLGVKKISNKERRRRQNENLRRLLTPKNALMVLNEMMPGEQLANQFKVENTTSHFYGPKAATSFRADLTLEGKTYMGCGENKLSARNAAAEHAIRDIIIKRMSKVLGGASGGAGAAAATAAMVVTSAGGSQNGDADDESLPMIQLASFALHKLFSEWECEGHKVPQLKQPNTSVSESVSGDSGGAVTAASRPCAPPTTKNKELPANAAQMHPCMLLSYMRPRHVYRALSVHGDKPQNMMFIIGVDVDGATYIGQASNRKEARKQAARSACHSLFRVQYDAVPPQL